MPCGDDVPIFQVPGLLRIEQLSAEAGINHTFQGQGGMICEAFDIHLLS